MPSTYSAQIVSIEGPDALAFAQAQFSSNVTTLADGQWQFSTRLDAQGRVHALFHLLRVDGERLQLLLRGGDAAALASSLQRYVFRAKVRIFAMPPQQLATAGPLSAHLFAARDGVPELGCGSHAMRIATDGDDGWRLLQLRAGWPWLPQELLGELLPAALELGALGATALDKGCYPGQEIVARLHYRGGNKRHLHSVRLSRRLPPGSVLAGNGQTLVQLLDVVGTDTGAEALAVVHDEIVARLQQGVDATHDHQPVFVQELAAFA